MRERNDGSHTKPSVMDACTYNLFKGVNEHLESAGRGTLVNRRRAIGQLDVDLQNPHLVIIGVCTGSRRHRVGDLKRGVQK